MPHLFKLATIFLRCIPAFFRSQNKQALVELALRQQLAIHAQKGPKPQIAPLDRAFRVLLSQIWMPDAMDPRDVAIARPRDDLVSALIAGESEDPSPGQRALR